MKDECSIIADPEIEEIKKDVIFFFEKMKTDFVEHTMKQIGRREK